VGGAAVPVQAAIKKRMSYLSNLRIGEIQLFVQNGLSNEPIFISHTKFLKSPAMKNVDIARPRGYILRCFPSILGVDSYAPRFLGYEDEMRMSL
jgi:hypothetical protein